MIFPRGVLFDFDGVLIDSEEWQIQAWIRALEELDEKPNEREIRLLSGYTDKEIAYRLLGENSPLAEEAIKKKQKMLEGMKFPPKKGAGIILRKLSTSAIPVVIVSATAQETINKKLIEYGWQDYISHVISSSSDIPPKPSPLLYEAAVNMLKIEPRYCVVIEDTLPGLAAAHHAGCVTIALAGTLKTVDLLQHADYVIEDLLDLLILLGLKQFEEVIIDE